jgi:hypothetical protein
MSVFQYTYLDLPGQHLCSFEILALSFFPVSLLDILAFRLVGQSFLAFGLSLSVLAFWLRFTLPSGFCSWALLLA